MAKRLVLFLAAALVTLPVQGFAADKPIKDVKELAGNWQGWVTAEVGDERATMVVTEDGRYKASTTRGTTAEGQFFLPNDRSYRTGSARYERVK